MKHRKMYRNRSSAKVKKKNSWTIFFEEVFTTIAIIFARRLLAKELSISQLWSKTWGPAFFQNAMSRNRITEIMKYLRSDIRSTRSIRISTAKFAISEIWNRFIDNCVACYKPGSNIFVYRQLFPCKWRCPFMQCITSKPDKFCVKFWQAVAPNPNTCWIHCLTSQKDDTWWSTQPVTEHVVLSLVKPYVGKGRKLI